MTRNRISIHLKFERQPNDNVDVHLSSYTFQYARWFNREKTSNAITPAVVFDSSGVVHVKIPCLDFFWLKIPVRFAGGIFLQAQLSPICRKFSLEC